ncbi:hypothetical protein CCM_00229 [Cordyceps militaris CM01]|uniref:Uncharacterized protein n=1 Tax=Cordyceps militaris (strain CM01) TaxID=983644 RepID=G3J2N9_CORMM|nr:uncharacterized protein CCM_00229 [Cordyceps militaris CM01]EGX95575.1 hypothetical protein CCM_00229 [Cordyceps militaris CM01]
MLLYVPPLLQRVLSSNKLGKPPLLIPQLHQFSLLSLVLVKVVIPKYPGRATLPLLRRHPPKSTSTPQSPHQDTPPVALSSSILFSSPFHFRSAPLNTRLFPTASPNSLHHADDGFRQTQLAALSTTRRTKTSPSNDYGQAFPLPPRRTPDRLVEILSAAKTCGVPVQFIRSALCISASVSLAAFARLRSPSLALNLHTVTTSAMRVSQLYVTASLAVAASAGIPYSADGAPPTSVDLASSPSSLPVVTAVGLHATSESVSTSNATVVASSHSLQTTPGLANHTSTHTAATSDAIAHTNATSTKPADATGGAILPKMQGSMAGLLGFCIMSLMLL